MDFIIQVHTTWGQETIFLLKGFSSKEKAIERLVEHYKKRHTELLTTFPDPMTHFIGHYIFGTDQVVKEITEVHDYYPPEE